MNFSRHHITQTQKTFRRTPEDNYPHARTQNSAFTNFSLGHFILIFLGLLLTQAVPAQIISVTGSPTSATSTTGTVTIPKPSGLAIGDVMIVNINQGDKQSGNNNLSNATSPGWTLIDGRQTGINGSDDWWGTVLYKVATATDVSATNFTFTFDPDADAGEGAIIAFRNVDLTGGVTETGSAGGPFDVAPLTINVTGTASTTLTASSTSTVTPYAAVIMLGMLGSNQT
ncbi:MAG TPA: hypothetical protein VJ508_13230, partial [Saprospiraceae bacterium]|nr:hypothetical protein [Saprospiraceae bacterium]